MKTKLLVALIVIVALLVPTAAAAAQGQLTQTLQTGVVVGERVDPSGSGAFLFVHSYTTHKTVMVLSYVVFPIGTNITYIEVCDYSGCIGALP